MGSAHRLGVGTAAMRRATAAACAALLVATLGAAAEAAPEVQPAEPPRSNCTVEARSTALEPSILGGESSTIEVALTADCPYAERPAHLVLLLDASELGRREGWRNVTRDMVATAHAIVDAIDFDQDPPPKVGVIQFGARATVLAPLSSDPAALHEGIDGFFDDYGLNLERGIYEALNLLNRGAPAPPALPAREALLLFTDLRGWERCPSAIEAMQSARRTGAILGQACLSGQCDTTCQTEMVTRSTFATELGRGTGTADTIALASDLLAYNGLTGLSFQATLPEGAAYVEGSGQPAPTLAVEGRLTWTWRRVPLGAHAVRFRVKPSRAGLQDATRSLWVRWVDVLDGRGEVAVAPARLRMFGPPP